MGGQRLGDPCSVALGQCLPQRKAVIAVPVAGKNLVPSGTVQHHRHVVTGDLRVELRHGQRVADEREGLLLVAAYLQERCHAGAAVVQRHVDSVDAELLRTKACIAGVLAFAGVPGETGHLFAQALRV